MKTNASPNRNALRQLRAVVAAKIGGAKWASRVKSVAEAASPRRRNKPAEAASPRPRSNTGVLVSARVINSLGVIRNIGIKQHTLNRNYEYNRKVRAYRRRTEPKPMYLSNRQGGMWN